MAIAEPNNAKIVCNMAIKLAPINNSLISEKLEWAIYRGVKKLLIIAQTKTGVKLIIKTIQTFL